MEKRSTKNKVEPIKCVWGLLCTLSSIDQEKNNISLFNVIEQINIQQDAFGKYKEEKKPVMIPHPHEIVMLFRRTLDTSFSDEEILSDLKLKTVDPDGEIVQEFVSPVKFPKGIKRLRYRIGMPGLMITTEGHYEHQIEIKLPNNDDFTPVIPLPFEVRKAA